MAPPTTQGRQCGAHDVHRAGQIRLEHRPPRRIVERREAAVLHVRSRGIHDDVHVAELGEERRDRALVRRVKSSRNDAIGALDELGASRERVYASALRRESARDGAPDAARGADNDRHATFEPHERIGERNVLSCAVGPAARAANASGPASSGSVPVSSPSETVPLVRSSSAAAKSASVYANEPCSAT